MKHEFYVNPLIDLVKSSIETFQGNEGLRLFISIIVCVFIASFTYPKYHKQSYVIYLIAKMVSASLERYDYSLKRLIRFIFSGIDTLWLSLLYGDLVYVCWYIVIFSLFFWCTIGTMFACNVREGTKIHVRIGLLFLIIFLICLFVDFWYPTLFFALVLF